MKNTAWVLLGMIAAVTSCAPKAAIVAETPAVKKQPPPPEVVVEETAIPTPVDDGLRMPDMLAMPEAGDFQSTAGAAKPGTQSGAVISRPPTDPPPRVKPKSE